MTDALGLLQQILVGLMSFWTWLTQPLFDFGLGEPVAPIIVFSVAGLTTILVVHCARLFIGG